MEIKRYIKGIEVKEGDLVLITYKEKIRRGIRVGWISFETGFNQFLGYDFMLYDEIKYHKLHHKGFTVGFHEESVEEITILDKSKSQIIEKELKKIEKES